MNLQRQHVTLKFKHTHMNDVLVETWRYFQLSGVPVIINAFKKKKLVPLNPPGEDTNTQAYIEAAHPSKGNTQWLLERKCKFWVIKEPPSEGSIWWNCQAQDYASPSTNKGNWDENQDPDNGKNEQEVWRGITQKNEPWFLIRYLCYCISGGWVPHDWPEPIHP